MARKKIFWILSLVCAILAAGIFAANSLIQPGDSEEYIYTIKCVYKWCFIPLCCFALISNPLSISLLSFSAASRRLWMWYTALGAVFTAIPLLSPPISDLNWVFGYVFSAFWLIGFFLLAFGLFIGGVKLNNNWSSILCLLGTLLFILCIVEASQIGSATYEDSIRGDSANSKYVLAGEADSKPPMRDSSIGRVPGKSSHPTASFGHRDLMFDTPVYDARYTFDDMGRRILPAAPKARNDLLIFGCSFTFGCGLENEQTWAWLLAKDLGPDWRLANYAYNGFGLQHMLGMLEDNMISPPTGQFRQALFLAIKDHIRRFTGLFSLKSLWYDMEDGKLVRKGFTTESPYAPIIKIPAIFNGSKAARWLASSLSGFIYGRNLERFKAAYVEMLVESAKILKDKYGTDLTVLLWPDIEDIAPELEKRHIRILFARQMLVDWDAKGEAVYHIVPKQEVHPNAKAAVELAAGLAGFYRSLAAASQNSQ